MEPIEIEFETFRLMRSGRYIGKAGAAQLIQDVKDLFKQVPEKEVLAAVSRLTTRLMKEET